MNDKQPLWGNRRRVPQPPGEIGGIGSNSLKQKAAATGPPRPAPPPRREGGPPGTPQVPPHLSSSAPSLSQSRKLTMERFSKKNILAFSVATSAIIAGAFLIAIRQDTPTAADEPSVEPSTPVLSPTTTPPLSVTTPIAPSSQWESIARSVVYIEATGTYCGWSGSGSIIGNGSYVLTNQHVSGDGECLLTVWLTDSTTEEPRNSVQAKVVVADSELDLAILQMFDASGLPFIDATRTPLQFASGLPKLGEKLTILGYPGLGGSTITLTSGDFSGVDSSETFDYLKTTANMNPGVSGGAALNAKGELTGIPTAGRGAEIACRSGSDCVANGSTIGLLRPANLASDLLKQISTN